MRAKILPIVLPADLYSELEHRGRAEERDALQQARWLLKQALKSKPVAAGEGVQREVAGAV